MGELPVGLFDGLFGLIKLFFYLRVVKSCGPELLYVFLGGKLGQAACHLLDLLHDLIVVHALHCQGFSEVLFHFGLFGHGVGFCLFGELLDLRQVVDA